MKTIHGILERAKLENMAAYLMSGSEFADEKKDDYEEVIKHSYHKFLDQLEELFPGIDRNNDELLDAIMELVNTQQETFLEVGISVGFQMHKNLDVAYEKLNLTKLTE